MPKCWSVRVSTRFTYALLRPHRLCWTFLKVKTETNLAGINVTHDNKILQIHTYQREGVENRKKYNIHNVIPNVNPGIFFVKSTLYGRACFQGAYLVEGILIPKMKSDPGVRS